VHLNKSKLAVGPHHFTGNCLGVYMGRLSHSYAMAPFSRPQS
jgi:hypothetical protein